MKIFMFSIVGLSAFLLPEFMPTGEYPDEVEFSLRAYSPLAWGKE